MHRHCDQNGTAPLVCNRKTTSQNKQWRKRRQVGVRRSEQQCAEYDAQQATEIALEYAVYKKSKKKFLDDRRDCHGENDDHHSLLNRSRSAEKLDDILLA